MAATLKSIRKRPMTRLELRDGWIVRREKNGTYIRIEEYEKRKER